MEEKDKNTGSHNGYFNAIIFLTLGIILLLNNFGVIDWNIWNLLWRFWPVILIIWGLKEVSEDSALLRLIAVLTELVLVGFIITYSLALSSPAFRIWLEANFPFWTNILEVQPKEVLKSSFV